jgi:hypothetical protein
MWSGWVRCGMVWSGEIWQGKDIMKENKIKTSFTLKPKVNTLIEILAKKLQISKTAIVTLAVLRFAEQEGVTVEDEVG